MNLHQLSAGIKGFLRIFLGFARSRLRDYDSGEMVKRAKPRPVSPPDQITNPPRCPHCGGVLRQGVTGRSNVEGIARGLVLVAVGIVLLVIPIVGWLIGSILIVVGLMSGGKTKKVIMCSACRSIIAYRG